MHNKEQFEKSKNLVGNVAAAFELDANDFSEKVARAVLLYGQNPRIIRQSHQLRYRKAKPIRAAIAVVNAFYSSDKESESENVIENSSREFYQLFFKEDLYDSNLTIKNYLKRMKNVGMVEEYQGKLKLSPDYPTKIINMLSSEKEVSINNTYFKAMAFTTGCIAMTENKQWENYPEEIAENVNERLIQASILKGKRSSYRMVETHIYPLHVMNDVEFYANDTYERLGIPATCPISISEYSKYVRSLDPLTPENIEETIKEISEVPIMSLSYIGKKFGMSTMIWLQKICRERKYNSDFPIMIVPNVNTPNKKIVISRSRIESLKNITDGKLIYSRLNFEKEPIWTVAPELFEVGLSEGSNKSVKETLKMILEGDVLEVNCEGKQKDILISLYNNGLADFHEGKFSMKNRKQISTLYAILSGWVIGKALG